MTTITQAPAELDLAGVAGDPFGLVLNIALTDATGHTIPWSAFTAPGAEVVVSGAVDASLAPTITSPQDGQLALAWNATQTATIGGWKTVQWALSATIEGVGPESLVAGTLTFSPATQPGPSGPASANLAVAVGTATASLVVTLGSAGVQQLTAADGTITIGGTATDVTVKVTPNVFDAFGAAAAAQAAAEAASDPVGAAAAVQANLTAETSRATAAEGARWKTRGTWTGPGTVYAVNDIVDGPAGFVGGLYRCITAHTSGTSFSAPGANWETVRDPNGTLVPIPAGTPAIGQVPEATSTASPPAFGWGGPFVPSNLGPAWQTNHAYTKGDVVSYQGDNYAALATFTSGTAFNPSFWLKVGTFAETALATSIGGITEPWGLAFDASGDLWVTSDIASPGRLYKITTSGLLASVSTPYTDPLLAQGQGIVFDTSGNCFVSINGGTFAGTITKITPGGVLSTFATTSATDQLAGMAIDASNNLIVTAWFAGTLYKVTPAGVVSTIATGLTNCIGVAVGPDGNYYVSGSGSTVWKVTPGGTVSTYATIAGAAQGGMVFSPGGALYVTTGANHGISRVPPGGSATGGSAFSTLTTPNWRPLQAVGLALDSHGYLFIAEAQNNTVTILNDGTSVGDLAIWGRSKRMAGQVSSSAPGSIPSGSVYTVPMNQQGWNSLGFNAFYNAATAAHGILVPMTGIYLFTYVIQILATTGLSIMQLWGAINGSDSSRVSFRTFSVASGQNLYVTSTDQLSLTAGQYIELHAFQSSGAAAVISGQCYMALTQIA